MAISTICYIYKKKRIHKWVEQNKKRPGGPLKTTKVEPIIFLGEEQCHDNIKWCKLYSLNIFRPYNIMLTFWSRKSLSGDAFFLCWRLNISYGLTCSWLCPVSSEPHYSVQVGALAGTLTPAASAHPWSFWWLPLSKAQTPAKTKKERKYKLVKKIK